MSQPRLTLVWSTALDSVALSTSGLEELGTSLCVTFFETHFVLY